jgi:hypothetical protein
MFFGIKREATSAGYGLIALLLLLSGNPRATGAVTFRTVVVSGQQAPGMDTGISIHPSAFSSINNAGQISFEAGLIGPGVDGTNNTSIWAERSGSLELVARAGDPVPGTAPGVVYESFPASSPTINGMGNTSFLSSISGTGVDATNNIVINVENSGSLQQIARTGDHAPGADPGVVFSGFTNAHNLAVLNDAGRSVFQATLTGTTGIWSDASGALELVARSGYQAPGMSIGTILSSLKGTPVLSYTGQTAFQGTLSGAGIDETNNEGLWMGMAGDLQVVAQAGDAAPDTGAGVVFGDSTLIKNDGTFNLPTLNHAGQIAFTGGLSGTGITETNNQGLWAGSPGSLQLVAQTGDTAPGTSDEFLYLRQPELNDNGRVAFQALLPGTGIGGTGSFKLGIWSDYSGTLELIALQGEQAPGVEEGVTFDDFNYIDGPEMNSVGQIAFRARLKGQNVDNTNLRGIWATDYNGALNLIARRGDLFDVNDDPLIEDLRTISYVDMLLSQYGGGENGLPTSLNDNGQLALTMVFTDGSHGLFVASTRLPGDLNWDGFVGIEDLNAVIGNWNQNVTPGDPLTGDPSGDGFVGIEDLNTVLGNWNTGTPPGAQGAGSVIPEPGTAAVLWVGAGLMLRRRGTAC